MGSDSRKLLFDLKINGTCQSAAFSADENYIFAVGDQAEIYQFDMRTQKCISRTGDEGQFSSTALAVSPNGGLLATGSKMGTVNFYKTSNGMLEEKPFKTLGNLTTAITDLQFNHSSEILSFSSKWKKNAFRFAHIPSYTVF